MRFDRGDNGNNNKRCYILVLYERKVEKKPYVVCWRESLVVSKVYLHIQLRKLGQQWVPQKK